MDGPPPDTSPEPVPRAASKPRWGVLALTTAFGAALIAFPLSPRTALYWYAFPLFGLGAAYLLQFLPQLPTRWRATFAASGVVSAVALALNWPFSGHVLWNVLFIGHAWTTGQRRTAWMGLLLGSLVYVVALKIAFQTPRDVVGAVISLALAGLMLAALRWRRPGRSR
jgi:hypothetical protein